MRLVLTKLQKYLDVIRTAAAFIAAFCVVLLLAIPAFATDEKENVVIQAPELALVPDQILVDGHEAEEIYINTAQGRFKFTAEIADTPQETQQGLMFRESMPHNHGMLFGFGVEKEVLMWMKNTPLPLDMVFLSPTGRVVSIATNTVPFSQSVISSKEYASGVLEINAGTSKLLGLKAGDFLEHGSFNTKIKGELKEKAN